MILNSINLNKQNRREIPKCTCRAKFDNKALELIPLPRIFNLEVVFQLLDKSKNDDSNPVVTYQLGKTIRNKIFNYKETVNSIYVDEDVSFCLNTDHCDRADSSLRDPHHHKHIITVDLQIIKNNKLRKFITKGPNCREPRRINFSKALIEITTAPDTFIEAMTFETKYTTSSFKPWKEKLLAKMKERITELNRALSDLIQFLATESPLKMMKNAFYFTSKACFVLEIIKSLS